MRDSDGLQSLLNAASVAETAYPTPSPRTPPSSVARSPSVSRKNSKRQRSRDPNRTPRDHRPMYTQEEADAILYYRDSVQLPWKKVVEAWNNLHDPHTGEKWGPRTISGLQSHYYRMLGFEKGGARRPSAPNPEIGLLKTTNRRYWWTYGSHPKVMLELAGATPDQLKLAAKQNTRRLRREVHKEGRQRKLAKRSCQNENALSTSSVAEQRVKQTMEVDISDNTSSYGCDVDSVSSIADTLFEQRSISDVDGYETSASHASSNTSAPPTSPSPISPPADFEVCCLRQSSGDFNYATGALPPFLTLENVADQGASKTEAGRSEVVPWHERVETLQKPRQEETRVAPPPLRIKNPMALANLLSF
ncbi:hypothetical protein ABW19_dt0203516 [Dactylella cylindrospora]|nr:hypothetical protein ABW19_dt0203516 [Dactylella cylindrospora]